MGDQMYVCMSVDCGRRSEEGSPCTLFFFFLVAAERVAGHQYSSQSMREHKAARGPGHGWSLSWGRCMSQKSERLVNDTQTHDGMAQIHHPDTVSRLAGSRIESL